MHDVFEAYLHSLREDRDDKTELSDRGALETLLNAAAKDADPKIRIIHEAKRVPDKGGPDFKAMKAGMILGYVENKTIGASLDELLKSGQIARYKQLSGNILLTDYLQFIWVRDGKVSAREPIAFPHDLEGKPKKPREDRVTAVATLLRGFFSTAPEGIGRSERLALALATRAHFLRDFLDQELRRQEKEDRRGKLYGLYEVFREQVFHELALAEFADAFAQMVAYGLFLARLNSDKNITLANARQFVPGSFRLIRELVQFLDELDAPEYDETRWVIEEILSIVNGLDLLAIHEDLSFKHRKAISRKVRAKDEEEHRLFERDPFIYFYEDFLGKYDAKMKKSRGVYYTPPPVVNFIVRAIDDILKDTFRIQDGLADHNRVTVLDFACGTGTFLLEVFQQIFDNIGGADSGKASLVVRDHMLRNVYGFEYLIAPYTIAHLKLSQFLADQGHPLTHGERLQVFLTNTLEPVEPQKNLLLPAVSAEVEAAQKIKETPILVITGNPPYSGHSKNKGKWITGQVKKYREGLPELSKPAQGKWLQDDYVKFIRFAQIKMDKVENGIVAIICNNSWLDNPTFKGMRKSLLETFTFVRVLDLHGSTKKSNRTATGGRDENVFDIEQGVCIALFIRSADQSRAVSLAELRGSRMFKYKWTAECNLSDAKWIALDPRPPEWLIRTWDSTSADSYRSFISLPEIFSRLGDPAPGIITTHDEFAISFDRSEAANKVRTLLNTSSEKEARAVFNLCRQDQWNYQVAKRELKDLNIRNAATRLAYRPFDDRWTIWDRNVAVHRRERVMRNLRQAGLSNRALSINTCRFVVGIWRHVLSTIGPTDNCLLSTATKERSYTFPLFIDGEEAFSQTFRVLLDRKYSQHFSSEEIFGFIYAILHSRTYRTNYSEFLKRDFPRIPIPGDSDDFEQLSTLGWKLVQVHLLNDLNSRKLAAYHGKGEHEVEFVRYSEADQAIAINKTQSFKPIPQAVWDFHIGGYQVLDKYLKSRKGRKLSLDEIDHVAHVADALAFTIEQMAKIDEAYVAAFPDRG